MGVTQVAVKSLIQMTATTHRYKVCWWKADKLEGAVQHSQHLARMREWSAKL